MEFSDFYSPFEQMVIFNFLHSPRLDETYKIIETYLQKNPKSIIDTEDIEY